MNTPTLIEYRVREVKRYILTRFEEGADESSGVNGSYAQSIGRGEYDSAEAAYEVGYALARAEHEALGWPVGDERIRYPECPVPKSQGQSI